MKLVASSAMPRGPLVHPEVAFFWETVNQGEFVVQRCLTCENVRFPPAAICWSCLSTAFELSHVAPSATLMTSIVVHRAPPSSPFSNIVPFRIGLFNLDNGLRVSGRILCECHEEIALGVEMAMCRVTSDNDYDVYAFAHECVL